MRIWLRDHWRTTALIAGVTVVAAAAVAAPAGITSLSLPPVPPLDGSIRWTSDAATPDETGAAAVRGLTGWLLAIGWAAAAVGIITILALAAQQATVRKPEIAIHRAVGASRRALAASALGEAALVVTVAIGLGAAIAALAGSFAAGRWPGVGGAWRPELARPLVTIAAAVLLGALFPLGAARSRRIAESELAPPPLGIAAVQLGASLAVLVTGAAVIAHAGAPRPDWVHLPAPGVAVTTWQSDTADPIRRAAAVAEWLAANPGGERRSVASPGAHAGIGTVDELLTDCGRCYVGGIFLKWRPLRASYHTASADTFDARGVRVVAGRGFDDRDRPDGPRVAVVNRYLALRYFESGNPIGRTVFLGGLMSGAQYQVVGVVDDGRPAGLGGGLQPLEAIYLASAQVGPASLEVVTDANPPTTGPAGYRLAGPAASGPEFVASLEAPATWFGGWFAAEGAALLFLAMAGTSSVMLLWIRALRSELAVRRAVGARRRDVVTMVLVRAARTGLLGIGVCLAFFGPAIWPELGSLIPGIPSWQPRLVAQCGALLVGAALVSAILPAIRSGRATPVELWSER